MQDDDLQQGQIVRVGNLSPGTVILASREHLDARQEGVMGRVESVTPTEGHKLAWVKHGKHVAPYMSYELVLVGVPRE